MTFSTWTQSNDCSISLIRKKRICKCVPEHGGLHRWQRFPCQKRTTNMPFSFLI